MASSVSSERAFSGAGITISRRRNRLKGDIVEALQVLKCAIRTELLVRPLMPSSVLEEQLEKEGEAELQMELDVEKELGANGDVGDETIFDFLSDDEDYEDDLVMQ
jgi:hypothetical protein